jgi:hypothetical protein
MPSHDTMVWRWTAPTGEVFQGSADFIDGVKRGWEARTWALACALTALQVLPALQVRDLRARAPRRHRHPHGRRHMVRPHNDVTSHGPDPDEVLHHVRESAARWQETAERIARQRDYYLQAVKDIDNVVGRLGAPHDTLARVEDILDQALGRS